MPILSYTQMLFRNTDVIRERAILNLVCSDSNGRQRVEGLSQYRLAALLEMMMLPIMKANKKYISNLVKYFLDSYNDPDLANR